MKNIAISGTWHLAIPGSNITTAVFDVDRACLWIASERLNADSDIEVDIYQKGLPDDSYEMEHVSAPLQDPSLLTGPIGRYRFAATADSTYRTRREACIMYKPSRAGLISAGSFSQECC